MGDRHKKHRDRESGSLPSIDVQALSFVPSFLTKATNFHTENRCLEWRRLDLQNWLCYPE